MDFSARFGSVHPLLAILGRLTGQTTAEEWVAAWLNQNLQRIDDPAFANQFSEHFSRFDADPADYGHRRVAVGDQQILAGIRFFGGDHRRPFVEVMAWSGSAMPDVSVLQDRVAEAWRPFRPRALRLLLPTAPALPTPSSRVDQFIHVARVKDIAQGGSASPAVTLSPVDDPVDAYRIAKTRYDAIGPQDPALGADISPADVQDLAECRRDGTLDYILHAGVRAGVLATLPAHEVFLRGHLVVEEVVSAAYSGNGLAQAAQHVLARRLVEEGPERLLFGTIDAKNHSSRTTAQRAGRSALFSKVFVDLK